MVSNATPPLRGTDTRRRDDPKECWHPTVRRLVTRELAAILDDLNVVLVLAGDDGELDRDDVRRRVDSAIELAFLLEDEADR